MQNDLIFVAGVFITSVAVIVGLGLFVISMVMEVQHRHRKRLSRVGRKRMSGRLDIDDARMALLRTKQDTNILVTLTDSLSRFLPLLNTTRLRANMKRAGMNMSVGAFIVISAVVAALIATIGTFATDLPAPLLVVPSLLAGMFVVDTGVKYRGDMVANRFMKQLPDGLDTIIRGIRSGLPVIECVAAVGEEFEDPIGGYFRAIAERVALGEPIDAALWRTARIVNRSEMDFLATSISIQMETGGSLSEALSNLADLLRQRERMKLKIKAISSEAKASAFIIGAMPFVMLGLLTVMSPDYVMPLYTDPRGHTMLMAGLGSISVGAFVMWRMTQFEI
jgi:tight adherence protein B